MNNEKRVVLLSLTILALLLTGFTWAYWNSGKVLGATAEFGNTISVGSGETEVIKTSLELYNYSDGEGKVLVPKGYESDESKVSEVTHQYLVKWLSEDNQAAKGYKIPSIKEYIKIEFYTENEEDKRFIPYLNNMFKVSVQENAPVVLDGEAEYRFNVDVKFVSEPEDQRIYDLLQKTKFGYKITIEIPELNN